MKLGFVGNKKKMRQFFTPFIEYASSQGVECVALEIDGPDVNIEALPRVNVLLQKVTDDMVGEPSVEAQQRVANLERYIALNREHTVVVEDMDAIRRLLDRKTIYETLATIDKEFASGPKFGILDTKPAQGVEAETLEAFMKQHDIEFPLVCKTLIACGLKSTHDMAIVFTLQGLVEYLCQLVPQENYPMIIQQYFNHNAVVNKVYVIGDHSTVVQRASLRNFLPHETESIVYNSQQPWAESVKAPADAPLPEPPSNEQIRAFSKAVRDKVGMDLLGYDLIVDAKSGKPYIIDVNYFPGYGGVKDVYALMLEYLKQRHTNTMQ